MAVYPPEKATTGTPAPWAARMSVSESPTITACDGSPRRRRDRAQEMRRIGLPHAIGVGAGDHREAAAHVEFVEELAGEALDLVGADGEDHAFRREAVESGEEAGIGPRLLGEAGLVDGDIALIDRLDLVAAFPLPFSFSAFSTIGLMPWPMRARASS